MRWSQCAWMSDMTKVHWHMPHYNMYSYKYIWLLWLIQFVCKRRSISAYQEQCVYTQWAVCVWAIGKRWINSNHSSRNPNQFFISFLFSLALSISCAFFLRSPMSLLIIIIVAWLLFILIHYWFICLRSSGTLLFVMVTLLRHARIER